MGGRGASRKSRVRTAKSVDRSKGLLLLAVAVIIMIFVFLGMFSSSSGTKGRAAKQNETESRQAGCHGDGAAENRGSVTPLLNADMSGQDGNSDQLSADDVKATGRLRMRPQPKPGDTLASIPPMDPALEAYRQAKAGYPAPQPPPMVASVPVAAPVPAHNDGGRPQEILAGIRQRQFRRLRERDSASVHDGRASASGTKSHRSAPEWQPASGAAAIRRQHGRQGAGGCRHRIQL